MPEARNLTARSLPYRETKYGTYTCERCGIQKPYRRGRPTICKDCLPEAAAFGWIAGPKTYECQQCGVTKQATSPNGTERTHCKHCTQDNKRNKAA